LLNIGHTPRFSNQGVLTALAWTRAGVPTYAFEGIIISSGSTLTWLRDQLGLAIDVPALEQLALSVQDSGGVHLIPAFTGLGLPHWQPTARAAILGLSSHSDRRHVARAGFESIGFQVRDALEAMRSEAGVPLVALHGDGGATASKFLMQFCADLCGVDLRVASMSDCSALGAVLAGQLGLGLVASLEVVDEQTRADVVYSPRLPASSVERLTDGWRRAVRQTILN